MPGLPLLAFTRRNACLQFSRSLTSSIHCSVVGLSALRSANSDSVPPAKAVGAAPLLSSGKASLYWLFCRLSVVESRRVLIAPFIPLRGPFGPSLLAQLSGRRRRAVRRWPPSAAQTARAVFPHAAFTKVRLSAGDAKKESARPS